LSIFAIAPESQPVSDERADKTAAHKGNWQRNIKARRRLAFGALSTFSSAMCLLVFLLAGLGFALRLRIYLLK
jgi:hypothetical protein